jgi:hypothetical protein
MHRWCVGCACLLRCVWLIACLRSGSFRIYSKTGREEKRVEASSVAAIISLRWNYDGSAIASASEDGSVKVWSRSGMLRSAIATCGACGVSASLFIARSSCFSLAPARRVEPLQRNFGSRSASRTCSPWLRFCTRSPTRVWRCVGRGQRPGAVRIRQGARHQVHAS